MSEIIPGLYLGGMDDAFNPALTTNTTVINMAIEVPQTPYANRYLYLPAKDTSSEKINKYFNYAIENIDNELKQGHRVLVHCFAGISRSATIVIAYLMKTKKWPFLKAYEFVKAKRPVIDPNLGFIYQLHSYDQQNI